LHEQEEKAKDDGKTEAPLGSPSFCAKEICTKGCKGDLRRRTSLLRLSAEEDQPHLKLQTKYSARGHGELGISQLEVEAALSDVRLDIKPRCGSPGAIRILQWNILADGLAKDGFLVCDVLSDAMDDSARAYLNNEQDELELKDVSSDDESLNAPAQVSSDRSKRNLRAVVDWKLRFLMIQKYVLTAKADVIVLQEVDHMLEMQQVFGQMGYACARDGKTYKPAHMAMEEHGVKRDSTAFFNYLRNAGVAFVPKTNSACRKLGLGEREDADDDGVAIFWRRDVLELVDLDFLVFDDPKRNQGAVRATLKRTEDGTRVAVIAAHLGTGSASKDEEARLKECKAPSLDATGFARGPSLCEWMDASAKMAPTVMCIDTNSTPNTERVEYEALKLNVWEALCSARPGIRSVWAAFYGPDGTPRQKPSPVTTNKIRGPLSAQAEKIGEHAFGLMDQMFFTACFSLLQHAYPPATFIGGAGDARGQLLPSLKVPSDHYPIIADIQLPIGLVTAWAKKTQPNQGIETLAQTMIGQTLPEHALLLKRQQLASEEQLIKLWYVRNWVTTVVGMSKFHDDLETCAQGTLTTTQGKRIGELLPKLVRSDSNKDTLVKSRIQFADAGACQLSTLMI
jgi:endonuclease/exonuclease/phosphatase family metal-dependent hydrolase